MPRERIDRTDVAPNGYRPRPDRRPDRGGRPPRVGRRWLAGLVAASAVISLVGVYQVLLSVRGAEATPTARAAIGGMHAQVTGVQWLAHDHTETLNGPGAAPGFQMPAGMMPGMPADGQARLVVRLAVANAEAAAALAVDPSAEFVLRDDADGAWRPRGDTFGGLSRLNPKNGVNGAVFFDVPATAANRPLWYLEWRRDGGKTRLAVPMRPAQETHPHTR